MIEEILPDLYRIEVPLPGNPLKAINSYVIKDHDRSLIIDTGMNRDVCLNAMTDGLKALKVDTRKADFLITHFHADHSGLVASLATDTSKIYFGAADADLVRRANKSSYWLEAPRIGRMNGFPEDEMHRAVNTHPGSRYMGGIPEDLYSLRDDDTLEMGDYFFKCIETPGHSKGHICLYESGKKIFISGDHILMDITPNIAGWLEEENPLPEYLASLDKVYDLEVELVLPGHRRIFHDYKGRIRELKQHHRTRADEALSILNGGSKNAFDVAALMTWDMSYKSWEAFPSVQKWFAVGEALSHLKFLEVEGTVRSEIRDQEVVFSPA